MSDSYVTDPTRLEDDIAVESTLRPSKFEDFIGQTEVVDSLKLYIEAANKRGESLDHVLLFGPPGLGKTTLANIISHELSSELRQSSGPVLERAGDLAGMLTNLQHRDVFFIDEIHRLNSVVEEYMYSAMEDYRIESVVLRVDYYDHNALYEIVIRSAGILEVNIDEAGAKEIGRRSRGTPRIANRILRRTRDYAEVKADGKITIEVAKDSLASMGIDEYGLDDMDRRILSTLIDKFQGGPVGVSSLSVAIGEDANTIEDVYEPFLIKEGFIQRTSRGRLAQERAFTLLGKSPSGKQQERLFE